MNRLHNNFSPSTFNLHVFFQISLNCFLRILNIIIVIIISPTLSYFAYLLMKNSNLPFRCFKGWETFNLFSWWRNHQMEHINTTLLWGKIKSSNLRYSLFYYPHDSSLALVCLSICNSDDDDNDVMLTKRMNVRIRQWY